VTEYALAALIWLNVTLYILRIGLCASTAADGTVRPFRIVSGCAQLVADSLKNRVRFRPRIALSKAAFQVCAVLLTRGNHSRIAIVFAHRSLSSRRAARCHGGEDSKLALVCQ